ISSWKRPSSAVVSAFCDAGARRGSPTGEAPIQIARVYMGMRHSIRLPLAAAGFAALAACSRSSEQTAISDDLKQDLAKAGGSDMLLAGAPAGRLDVVSAAERTNGA